MVKGSRLRTYQTAGLKKIVFGSAIEPNGFFMPAVFCNTVHVNV